MCVPCCLAPACHVARLYWRKCPGAGGGAVDKLVVPCCVLLLHGSRYIGRPRRGDGRCGQAGDSMPRVRFPQTDIQGGRWGREVNNLVIPWWAQAFCSGMTSVMSPMVNPEPVSPRRSPLVVTGKPTFVERAPAGGASRLRLRGRGPVGAVRKRRVRYKSRPWEGASMTWRYLALSKSIPPPPTLLFPRWRLACRKRV